MISSEEKNKVSNLFQFLKQYNNIKNPTITDISAQHWNSWIDDIPNHKNIKNNIHKEDDNTEAILSVSKPKFYECPEPPEELKQWLLKGWSKFDEEVKTKEKISRLEKK